MWFCYKQNGKEYEVSQTFKPNTELSHHWQYSSLTAIQKSRIGLLHRNQFAEGIQLTWTIISRIYRKNKICKKRYWYNYLSLIFVIQTMKVEVAHSKMQHCSTLDAPKNFWMTPKTVFDRLQHDNRPNSHSISQSCLLEGKRNSKMLQNKLITTIIPSKISSAYECNKTITLLPRFEPTQIFEHERTKQHIYQKSQHQSATFLYI